MKPRSSLIRYGREMALWVGAILGGVCIVASLLSLAFDVRPFVFRSGSMSPAIGVGALGFGQETQGDHLRQGDVISVVNPEGVRITHRIVEIVPEGDAYRAILKGDANPAADSEPYRVETAYRIFADIPKAGYVVNAMTKPPVVFAGGAVVAMLLMSAFMPGQGGAAGGRSGRSGGVRRKALAVIVAAGVTGAGASSMSTPGTWAYFNDSSTLTTGTFTPMTVTKPAWVSCTVSGVLGKTITVVWAEESARVPFDYTAIVNESGQSLTVIDNGTTRQTSVTSGLLGIGTSNIRITAKLPSPNGSWVSVYLNQPVTFVTSLIASCGTPS